MSENMNSMPELTLTPDTAVAAAVAKAARETGVARI